MIKKIMKLKSIIILPLVCIFSCNSPNIPSFSSKNIIKGIVEFPSKIENEFSTKAEIEDIAYNATVSLIYPADNENANETISTTLTNENGSFSISTENYTPQTDDILILEAIRRIGSSGNNIMSLRTNIKWTGSQWISITTPNIYINSKTTAICIMESNDENIIAEDTIGKVDYSVNPTVISNIGTSPNIITSTQINDVADLVITSLSNNNDPVSNIIRSPINKYFIDYSETLGNFIQTGECENCILTNSNLSDLNLKGFNLSGSNLSNSELVASYLVNSNLNNVNLTNARLVKADLTNANLTGTTITGTDFKYSDLSQANLTGLNLSSLDLTGVLLKETILVNTNLSGLDLKDKDLSGADLTGATVTGTDFTGTDLSDAVWINGTPFTGTKICGANSIGVCN